MERESLLMARLSYHKELVSNLLTTMNTFDTEYSDTKQRIQKSTSQVLFVVILCC